ncbi:MAG: protein kinase, partial [Planctomycetota bacterium]
TQYEPADPATQVINPAVAPLIDSGILEPPDPAARSRGAFAMAASRYELTSVLGEGGMGIVFKAHDRSGDCCVAVKTLKPNFLANAGARKRFIDEAKEMNKIPASARVLVVKSFGTIEQPYYVTEFLPNGTLGGIIRKQGTLTAEQARRFTRDIAQAVAYIHSRQGKLHRDIKPENVLIDADGSGWLADFGLVWQVGETSVGLRAGTLPYMPPEVVSDERRDVGFEWDLYSIGATMYEMLVGHAPYADVLQRHALAPGQSRSQLLRALIAQQPPTPILRLNRKAPKPLVKIADWAMARDRRDRYLDADQMCNDLDRVGKNRRPLGPDQRESMDESIDSAPAGGLENFFDRLGIPSPGAVAHAARAGVLLACIGAAIYFAMPYIQGEPEPSPAPGVNAPADPAAPGDPNLAAVVDPGGAPGADPGVNPATHRDVDPGTDPGTDPTLEPGGDPGSNPGTNPGTDPGADPGTDPAVGPGTDPGERVAAAPPLIEQSNPNGPYGLKLEVFKDPPQITSPSRIGETDLIPATVVVGHATDRNIADAVRIKISLDRTGYVWLLMKDPNGDFRSVLPASEGDLGSTQGALSYSGRRPTFLPPLGSQMEFAVSPPGGEVTLLAIVAGKRWRIDGVTMLSDEPLSEGEEESEMLPLVPASAQVELYNSTETLGKYPSFDEAFGDDWQTAEYRFTVTTP